MVDRVPARRVNTDFMTILNLLLDIGDLQMYTGEVIEQTVVWFLPLVKEDHPSPSREEEDILCRFPALPATFSIYTLFLQ